MKFGSSANAAVAAESLGMSEDSLKRRVAELGKPLGQRQLPYPGGPVQQQGVGQAIKQIREPLPGAGFRRAWQPNPQP